MAFSRLHRHAALGVLSECYASGKTRLQTALHDCQVPWSKLVAEESTAQSDITTATDNDNMLCSMAWLPDGSALTVLDKWGNAALLDTQGMPHSWHVACSKVTVISGKHKVLPYKLWAAKAASQHHRYH